MSVPNDAGKPSAGLDFSGAGAPAGAPVQRHPGMTGAPAGAPVQRHPGMTGVPDGAAVSLPRTASGGMPGAGKDGVGEPSITGEVLDPIGSPNQGNRGNRRSRNNVPEDPTPSAFDNSARLMEFSGDLYGNLAETGQQGLGFQDQAGRILGNIASGGTGSGEQMMRNVANRYQSLSDPNRFDQVRSTYENEYEDEVMQTAARRARLERDRALSDVGANAASAGAFGGSRQALLEAEVISNSTRDMAEMRAQLGMQGMQESAGLAQMDLSNRYQALQGWGGSGQSIAAQRAGAAANLGTLGAQTAGYLPQAASGAQGLAGQYFDIGNSINNTQAQYGTEQQRLQQALLDQANSNFDRYTQRPQEMLDVILAATGGSPLQRNQTTSYTPGLFDYLSLGAGMAGSAMRGGM